MTNQKLDLLSLDHDYRQVARALNHLRDAVILMRKLYGFNLREVALNTGVSLNALSRFERGAEPSLGRIVLLATWVADLQDDLAQDATTTCAQADTCMFNRYCESYLSCLDVEVSMREVR